MAMDKVKGFLKDTFRSKGQDQDISDEEEPQEYATDSGSHAANTGGSSVGFGGVSFSDDPPPPAEEPPKKGLRFADVDDEKPHKESGGMNV